MSATAVGESFVNPTHAAAPGHFHGHGFPAGGEHPHRVIARQITPAGNHLLRLNRDGAAEKFDLCADAMRIRFSTFQSHTNPRCRSVITQEKRGVI
jgi:hypothetical protein